MSVSSLMKGRSAPNAIMVGENKLGFDARSCAFLFHKRQRVLEKRSHATQRRTRMLALHYFRTLLSHALSLWCWLNTSLFDPYRPELHYMRGPGPKWREKHVRSVNFAS